MLLGTSLVFNTAHSVIVFTTLVVFVVIQNFKKVSTKKSGAAIDTWQLLS